MSETLSIMSYHETTVPSPSPDYYSPTKVDMTYIGMIAEPTPHHVFSSDMDPATFEALDTLSDREELDGSSDKPSIDMPEEVAELKAQNLANLAIETVLRAYRTGDTSYRLEDFLTGVEAAVMAKTKQKFAELPENWLEVAS